MNAADSIPKKYQTWNKSYLLDISMIDKQHAKFFMLFDKLLVLNKKKEFPEDLSPLIDELEKYTKIHFQAEEALMRKARAPEYEIHLTQHDIFKKKIEEFKIAYKYNNSELLEQMIIFMRKWFLMHIAEVDGKYVDPVKKYLTERGTINIE